MKNNYEFERTVERELLVPDKDLAEQLASTNISARAFVKHLKEPSLAMAVMRTCSGMTIQFPADSTIVKSAITVLIRQELSGTYKGRKDRRAAVKKVQQILDDLGIHLSRQKIERIFKAKRWVE